jgi:hypothetical protein
MQVSYIEWQTKASQAEMTENMLILDSVSCAIVSISMPAFFVAFIAFGNFIR